MVSGVCLCRLSISANKQQLIARVEPTWFGVSKSRGGWKEAAINCSSRAHVVPRFKITGGLKERSGQIGHGRIKGKIRADRTKGMRRIGRPGLLRQANATCSSLLKNPTPQPLTLSPYLSCSFLFETLSLYLSCSFLFESVYFSRLIMPRSKDVTSPKPPPPVNPPVNPLANDVFNDVSGDYRVQPGFGQSIVRTTQLVVLSHVDSESKTVKGKQVKGKQANSKQEPNSSRSSNSKEPNSSRSSNSKPEPNSSRPSTQPNSSRPSTAAQQKFVDLVPGDIKVEPGFDRSFLRAKAGAVNVSSPSSIRNISGSRR